jgi:hypothetical protein
LWLWLQVGLIGGRIGTAPFFLTLDGVDTFQKTYEVRLERSICKSTQVSIHIEGHKSNQLMFSGPGDCGAWVIDPKSGELYGHIIAGRPGCLTAYLVSASQIKADIEMRMNMTIELPTRESIIRQCSEEERGEGKDQQSTPTFAFNNV